MKKYALLLAVGLTLSGNADAITDKDFEKFLDDSELHYPVLKALRTEENFLTSAKSLLNMSSKKTPEEVLNDCLKENMPKYINSMSGNSLYFNLVEGLDPVFRDLNPNCGTNGNRRPVKGIFHQR